MEETTTDTDTNQPEEPPTREELEAELHDLRYEHAQLADELRSFLVLCARRTPGLDALAQGLLDGKESAPDTPEGELQQRWAVLSIIRNLRANLGDAPNYITMTVETYGEPTLEVTIRRCPDGKTPADVIGEQQVKIDALTRERDEARAALATEREAHAVTQHWLDEFQSATSRANLYALIADTEKAVMVGEAMREGLAACNDLRDQLAAAEADARAAETELEQFGARIAEALGCGCSKGHGRDALVACARGVGAEAAIFQEEKLAEHQQRRAAREAAAARAGEPGQ